MSKGSNKVLAAEIVLQGIGVLISWNAILTALDWYNNRFPNKDPGFWFPLLNFIPAAIFQPLTILYGHKFTFNHRIIPSYIIVALVLGLTPIIVELTSEDLGFIIICILTVFAGMVNAIGQTSVFGLAGTLPNEYTNAVMLGNGLSGLSITCLRLICLGIFTQNSEGYLHSTELYFGISAVVLILCVFAQMHLMKHELVIEGLGKTHSKEGQTPMVAAFNELDSFRDSSGFNVKEKEKVSYPQLFKQIWQYLFLVWINYFITFGVLSHVALATTADGISYPVFTTLLILFFNFFDVCGRYTPMFVILKGTLLWVVTLGRFVFWVTFILIASDDPRVSPGWLFNATWFKFINMALYAYTNGFSSTSSMILGPSNAPHVSKDKAGYIMVTGLITGIFCGQIASFGFINIGYVPT